MVMMTTLSDYHVHSDFSPDCAVPMAAMARQAVALGLPEILFCEHQEYHPLEGDSCRLRADEWFAEIARLNEEHRGRLVIRAGIEVGQPHRYAAEVRPLLAAYPFDAVTGSLHWIGNHNVFDPAYFAANPNGAGYRGYFEELVRLATAGGFDILAHIDVIKREGFKHYGFYDIRPYEELVRATFRGLIANGIALEINTAGLRRTVNEAHPPLVALRWYRELGGELLTLGSDAHQPEHIAHGFDVAREMARAAGFERVVRYRQRQAEWAAL
jgi:histidinol-phosphatase (PHP family)